MAPFDAQTLSGPFADRYTIDREIGRGGTAHVFLARDQRHGTPVAIKVLRKEIAETIGADRFLREIRLSAGLHHPHILPVLDSGTHSGALYFTLPLADGGTLRQRLTAERQLPIDKVIEIVRTIASAMDHAHSKGLIHRDIKPENILFASKQACLADFGIARALEHATSEYSLAESTTSSGIVRGTPAYMSPEQASGETNIDGRSDLYSFACVVYEMLSGMMPFDGPTPQSVIAMRFTHSPRPVRQFRPSLPPAIDAFMARALAVAPADRYQSGADFLAALEAAARSSDPMVTPPAMPAHRRTRWLVGGGTLAAIAAISAVAWARWEPSAPDTLPNGDPRRVAVMYFDNLTPATLPRHVADGITDDLIDQLGQTRALQVISPFGTRQFRGGDASMDSIQRALKVGTIITGSIEQSGDSVRLNARMVDAKTRQQIASVPVAVASGEVLALRRELTERVAFLLRQRIGERIAIAEDRATTRSQAAWEAVQLAGTTLNRASEGRMWAPYVTADSLYRHAAGLDPQWPLPWIGRATVASRIATNPAKPPPGGDSIAFAGLTFFPRRALWLRYGLQFADSAVRRDSRSARALGLRGELLQSLAAAEPATADSVRALAERDLRAAIALRPDAAQAWTALATLLQSQYRFADAAEAAQRGYDADPWFDSRATVYRAFSTSLHAQDFANSSKWCALGLEHYATDSRFMECRLTLLGWSGSSAAAFQEARRNVAAIERADTLSRLYETWGYRRLMVAAAAARAGMRDTARAILAEVRSPSVPDSLRGNSELGESYVMLLLGNRDSSLAILRRYATTPRQRSLVRSHPWFVSLREDRRFKELTETR